MLRAARRGAALRLSRISPGNRLLGTAEMVGKAERKRETAEKPIAVVIRDKERGFLLEISSLSNCLEWDR